MKKLTLLASILFLTVNGYSQWVQCYVNGTNGTYVRSLASSGNNIFASFDFGICISTNNGANWTQNALNNETVFSLAANGNNIFAGTYGHGVYLSTNNGANWTQTSFNNHSAYSFAIIGNNIFAGSFGLYLSTNNGANWTQIALNETGVYSLATSGNNIFAGTGYGVYLSSNNGANWTQTALNNQPVWSLAISGNNIIAGTWYGICCSTNNGANWTQTAVNNTTVASFAVNANNIFAGADYGGVYLSTNNGLNWIQRNQGFGIVPCVYALLIANGYVFAGISGSSVWRRNLNEAIGIKNISLEIPSSFSLSQNYPNPFNPSTNIRYTIPSNVKGKMSNVKLVVFDILGKEIATLVNEKQNAGTYEAIFDGSGLTSGFYFYRLTCDDFSETRKMVLIK